MSAPLVTIEAITNYPADGVVDIVEGTIYLHRPGGFEIADRDRIPDDRRRHELIDGVIISSPLPNLPHQRALTRLAIRLVDAVPKEHETLPGPLDVQTGPRTVVQPDVLVLPSRDMEAPMPLPTLVVEVLSPFNRDHDLVAKRDVYQAAGVPSYWIIDPDEPSITILELQREQYVEIARANGDQQITAHNPYEITLVPNDLVR